MLSEIMPHVSNLILIEIFIFLTFFLKTKSYKHSYIIKYLLYYMKFISFHSYEILRLIYLKPYNISYDARNNYYIFLKCSYLFKMMYVKTVKLLPVSLWGIVSNRIDLFISFLWKRNILLLIFILEKFQES